MMSVTSSSPSSSSAMKVESSSSSSFDGLVDLDVVFRLGNDGLDLAGVLLGVGFLERAPIFGLARAPALRAACGGAALRRAPRVGRGRRDGAIGTTSPV
jgi:hypothetical protein